MFCILDLSKHRAAIQSDCNSCQTCNCNADIHKTVFTYTDLNELLNVCKERAEALVKTIH